MKKSKHFRKDVIMARVIAGVIVVLLIALIVLGVSLLTKPSGNDKDTQSTQNTQNTQDVGNENVEPEVDVETEYETESEAEETEVESEEESETVSDGKTYVKTTTQVKLRKEPNTECATLDRIDGGTKLEVLETLDGWYKVIHNGQEGYVSADYANLVEE